MTSRSELAPSGTPIPIRDLLKWLIRQPFAATQLEEFRAAICHRYRLRHCFFVSSGRAAMYLLFRALRTLAGSRKTEVIVPSYTCYSVPAAAIRAGLRVRILDIDPRTLSYDLEQLAQTDFSNVLAIVSSNLYGIPNDLPGIAAIARQHGVYFLDDAAQSLNASVNGQPAGSFGDAGLYSLDKGKNITSIQGGILVTQSDTLAAEIRKELAQLLDPPWQRTFAQAIQLLIYAMLLRPWLYWIPARLPFLKLGTTRYEIDYPVEHYSPSLGIMAALLFRHIDELTQKRVAAAQHYFKLLRNLPFLDLPQSPVGASPVYLRFPVMIHTPELRERLLAVLQAAGLGATASYPGSTLDVPEAQSFINHELSHGAAGRALAARILTLPTHPYVHPQHIERICTIIREEANHSR